MRLDVQTLFLSATGVIAWVGILLVLAWRQGDARNALRPWGASLLLGAVGLGLMGFTRGMPDLLSYRIPNALIIAATGLAWAAARSFDSRPARPATTLLGVGAWVLAWQMPIPAEHLGLLPPGIASCYLAAAAIVMWRGRNADPLPSRDVAVGLLAAHAAFVGLRAMAALAELSPAGAALPLPASDTWAVLLLAEAQLHALGMAMALLAMAKERAERIANAALVASRDAADAANEAKSRFVAHVSHELRTPMNAVLGMAQALAADTRLLADQKVQARTLELAGRHLIGVAGNVLDLARAEAGKLDVAITAVPIGALLSECAELSRSLADAKDIRLTVTLEVGLPPAVLADPTRLRQVLLNLLSNGVKFTPAGGAVELRARRAGFGDGTGPAGMIVIEVVDTGPGIPAEKRDRLFREYSRLVDSGGPAGAGLGLSICAALMRAMEGRIGHRPGPSGIGSCFWIELPGTGLPGAGPGTDPGRAPRRTAAPVPLHGPTASSLRVLVVDDVPTNRLSTRYLLQRLGHRVVEASDGTEAAAMVAAGDADLVLMDINMPGMDGFEATRRIRMLPDGNGRLPIIALTADVRPAAAEACRVAGMDGCLAKPFDINALRAVLDTRHAPGLEGRAAEPGAHREALGQA